MANLKEKSKGQTPLGCLCLIIAFAIIMSCAPPNNAKKETKSSLHYLIGTNCKNGPCIVIEADKAHYSIDDPIILYVTLLNKSNDYYIFSKFVETRNLLLIIKGENGNDMHEDILIVNRYFDFDDCKDFFLVQPNGYIGQIITIQNSSKIDHAFKTKQAHLLYKLKPGKYTIKMILLSIYKYNRKSILEDKKLKFTEDQIDQLLKKDIYSNELEISIEK